MLHHLVCRISLNPLVFGTVPYPQPPLYLELQCSEPFGLISKRIITPQTSKLGGNEQLCDRISR